MKNLILVLFVAILAFATSCAQPPKPLMGKQVQFESEDGLLITADLYDLEDKTAPLIVLFHQAGFSRGEYREIAPKLNKLGFRCLAIDQRSGKEVNGVINETNKRATESNMPTEYIHALPDLVSAVNYSKTNLAADKIIIWGSSYSAALVMYLGAKYKNDITGILAFSPGEYFKIGNQTFSSYASGITKPVFITSAKNEQTYWQAIYDAIPGEKYFYLPKTEGVHGSRALWSSNEGNELCWEEVTEFLNKIK